MNAEELNTLEQLRSFLDGNQAIAFEVAGKPVFGILSPELSACWKLRRRPVHAAGGYTAVP